MIFLLIETIIQVTLPDLHVTWLCVTLLSVLYFIYCSEMWNQLDALTGLLNQNSYLNRTAEMRRNGGVLVVFDVDDFKQINDRYGHLQGISVWPRSAAASKSLCPQRLLLPYRRRRVLCSDGKRRPGGPVCAGVCTPAGTAAKSRGLSAHGVLWLSSFWEDVLAVKNRADREMYRYKRPGSPMPLIVLQIIPSYEKDCCTGVSLCGSPFPCSGRARCAMA